MLVLIQNPLSKFQRILVYLKPVMKISMETIATSNLDWSFFFQIFIFQTIYDFSFLISKVCLWLMH